MPQPVHHAVVPQQQDEAQGALHRDEQLEVQHLCLDLEVVLVHLLESPWVQGVVAR